MSSNATQNAATTNTTTSNVTTLPTAPKPQTSKEVIQANVQLLIEQLEAGHSEGLTAYLTAMGRFHNYSFGNILEIARQKPDATRVAGLYAWNQLGRKVMKGQKGIRILAPMIGTRKKKDTEANKDITRQNQPVLVGFRAVYVFDVSQTEGAELPAFTERTRGEVGEFRERLIDFTIAQGIQLEFKDSIAPALGMSYGGRIAILPGQEPAEEFSTLVHELAHEMLHKAERRTATTKTVRETEAEAIAFVVSQTIGLDAGRASADYIHLYHGNAALLTESLEVIQRTAALILSAIETKQEAAEPTEAEPSNRRHRHRRSSSCGGGLVQTILDILRKAGGWHPGLYLKIDNAPYMELVIEAVDESGPHGSPRPLSRPLRHSRTATSCATRRCVSSLDSCTAPHLNPFTYRNDYVGVEQWSRNIVRSHYVHLVQLHEQHQRFAKTWDNNLRLQGYAEAFDPQKHVHG